jgi:hypothetical protein
MLAALGHQARPCPERALTTSRRVTGTTIAGAGAKHADPQPLELRGQVAQAAQAIRLPILASFSDAGGLKRRQDCS